MPIYEVNLAQLVERMAFNHMVVGSSPTVDSLPPYLSWQSVRLLTYRSLVRAQSEEEVE